MYHSQVGGGDRENVHSSIQKEPPWCLHWPSSVQKKNLDQASFTGPAQYWGLAWSSSNEHRQKITSKQISPQSWSYHIPANPLACFKRFTFVLHKLLGLFLRFAQTACVCVHYYIITSLPYSHLSRQLVRESKQRLDAQRQEYEGAIARHQVVIKDWLFVSKFKLNLANQNIWWHQLEV